MPRKKITLEQLDPAIEALKRGATYKLAAEAAGVAQSTFYKYLRKGREGATPMWKEFFKRVLCYNLDGSLKKDIFVKLGDKIADSDHLGDLIYNVGGKGYLYSYALSRVDGKNLVNYSCYNQKMELEWEKQYDSKIKTGSVKRIISSASIEMLVDSSIVITSYYGLDEMSFKYSNSIKTFEFKLLEYKSQGCEIPFKYGLDCSLYIKLSQYKGCKNFIDGDMKKTKDNVTVIPYFTNDRVIISKQTIRMLEIPDQYIALYMFKL